VSKQERGFGLIQAISTIAVASVIAVASWSVAGRFSGSDIRFTTPYQAVLLSNGSVYFGHLDGYGSGRPVLSDVFYVVTQTNPDTKQSSNILIKRGKELHEPDRMYLTPSSIVFVEPVGPKSKVAQLIAEAK
jgi:hypothetical protein